MTSQVRAECVLSTTSSSKIGQNCLFGAFSEKTVSVPLDLKYFLLQEFFYKVLSYTFSNIL